VANGRTSAARRTGATALLLADIPNWKEKKPKKQENHGATRFSFVEGNRCFSFGNGKQILSAQ
jgi:hypothetical protein